MFSRVEPAVEIGWLYSIGGGLDLATSGWIDVGFQKLGKLYTAERSRLSGQGDPRMGRCAGSDRLKGQLSGR